MLLKECAVSMLPAEKIFTGPEKDSFFLNSAGIDLSRPYPVIPLKGGGN
jgi:hypothetical protein